MHTKTAALTTLLLLAAAMGSAELLNTYGAVEGSSTVSGPVFYAAEVEDELSLKINEKPNQSQNFLYRQIGPEYSSEFFVSPELEAKNWYEMEVDFFVKAKTFDDSGNIQASLLYDTENSSDNLICATDIYVNSTDYTAHTGSCSSTGSLGDENITGFTYKLDGGREKEFNIKADGVTRVEVNRK